MRHLSAFVALTMISLNASAALHKWVDADGGVHYSDTVPPDVSTQSVRNVTGKDQANAPASFSPKSVPEREAEMRKSRQEKEEAAKKKAQQDTDTETRKRNCEAARQNARALEEGTRMVTYDANGERSFLDDEARVRQLEDARKAISSNCD